MGAETLVRPSRSTVPVHARIAARRHELERGQTRRRLRWLVALAVILVLILAVLAVARSPVLSVSRVEINLAGAKHISVRQVESAANVPLHTPLVGVDVGAIAQRIAQLPWVETATVQRVWPQTLSVSVTERRPVAQAPNGAGGWSLVDEAGRVMQQQAQAWPGFVRLDQPVTAAPGGSTSGAFDEALALAGRLPSDLAAKLSVIGGKGAGLTATLPAGGTVKFCGLGDLAAKILALNTMLDRVQASSTGTVDVCVPGAPVLTPAK